MRRIRRRGRSDVYIIQKRVLRAWCRRLYVVNAVLQLMLIPFTPFWSIHVSLAMGFLILGLVMPSPETIREVEMRSTSVSCVLLEELAGFPIDAPFGRER